MVLWQSGPHYSALSDLFCQVCFGVVVLQFALVLIVFFSFSGELTAETMDDLLQIDGRYYTISGNIPFTGSVVDPDRGSFKDGLKHGAWIYVYDNGRIKSQGQYQSGMRDGEWLGYYRNGNLFYKGSYANGKKEGHWISYYEDETLFYKGAFHLGKPQGKWVAFNPDGTVWQYRTGVFEAGVKISD